MTPGERGDFAFVWGDGRDGDCWKRVNHGISGCVTPDRRGYEAAVSQPPVNPARSSPRMMYGDLRRSFQIRPLR